MNYFIQLRGLMIEVMLPLALLVAAGALFTPYAHMGEAQYASVVEVATPAIMVLSMIK